MNGFNIFTIYMNHRSLKPLDDIGAVSCTTRIGKVSGVSNLVVKNQMNSTSNRVVRYCLKL